MNKKTLYFLSILFSLHAVAVEEYYPMLSQEDKQVLASMQTAAKQLSLQKTQQLIVVRTATLSSTKGILQRYVRSSKGWQKTGKTIGIKVGRNGLGWGRGLHEIPQHAKSIKKEGDGKAPMGIFWLEQAFGYAPFKTSYPYKVYTSSDHCVDDVNSVLYNKLVKSRKLKKLYGSHERMRFPKNYYEYGIVVNHNGILNHEYSKKGAGSCIFLHIKQKPTAGCTVMRKSEMKNLIHWLDKSKEPLLVQGTKKEVKKLLENIVGFN